MIKIKKDFQVTTYTGLPNFFIEEETLKIKIQKLHRVNKNYFESD